MPKDKSQPAPASPVGDVVETAAADRMGVADDDKLKSFHGVVSAVKSLSKADQYAVLSAAAQYFGLTIKLQP